MNISELKIDNGLDDVSTVGEFLEKYAKNYPKIDEEEFKKQLIRMETMFKM